MSATDEAIASLVKQMGNPELSDEQFRDLAVRVERLKRLQESEADS